MVDARQHVLQPYLQRYVSNGGRACFHCVREIIEGFELCYGAYSKRFCCKHCAYDWFDELDKEHQQFVLDNIQFLGKNMDEHESDYQLIGLDKSGKENWSDPTGSGHGLRYQRPASATHPYTSAADEASGESVPFELRHQIGKKPKEDKL